MNDITSTETHERGLSNWLSKELSAYADGRTNDTEFAAAVLKITKEIDERRLPTGSYMRLRRIANTIIMALDELARIA